MEYGILVVENDEGRYQILGAVWSLDEARELADTYFANGYKAGCIAPDSFAIHRRGVTGMYTNREPFEL